MRLTGNPHLTRRWPFGRVTEGLPTNRAVCAVELKVQHAHLQNSIVLCTMAHPRSPHQQAGGDPISLDKTAPKMGHPKFQMWATRPSFTVVVLM